MKNIFLVIIIISILFPTTILAKQTLLLRDPDISDDKIAFVYGGDIWVAKKDGSQPTRLTSSPVDEQGPIFSSDGKTLAFTAKYNGNTDVYIIDIDGGQPKRLTWHPGPDIALDWSADGEQVAFASRRETNHGGSAQLYHVSVNGGLPIKKMEARIFRGTYNASGSHFAYISYGPAYNGLYGGTSGWRGYRGGSTPTITVMDMVKGNAHQIPGALNGMRSNNIEPMWMDDKVYFLSDRKDKIFNLYQYNPTNKTVKLLSNETIWDIRSADAKNGVIIYEAGGRLKQFNITSKRTKEIAILIKPDLPQLRPKWKQAGQILQHFEISPSGKRVLITARGEVFSIPVKHGSTRNLSKTSGTREYSALWSPLGEDIAYIDASERNQYLVIKNQNGLSDGKRYKLGSDFYTLMKWSADGTRIIYQDNHLKLHFIYVNSGRKKVISTGARRESVEADISPDSRWVAFTEEQANFNRQLKLYDFNTGQVYPIGNALADASTPVFSRDGKYLYFAASTNSGPQQVGLDMSSQERPYRAAIYAVVLNADGASPMKPQTGDENLEETKKAGDDSNKPNDKVQTKIDIDNLSDRIIALPIEERNYSNLSVAKDGTLYYVQHNQPGAETTLPGSSPAAQDALYRFGFKEKKAEQVSPGITQIAISAKGTHLIMRTGKGILQTAEIAAKIEVKPLDLSGARLLVNPREEWKIIFNEVWLMEKAYFYDPNMHGLDWQAVYDRYKPLISHVARREDLTTLIVEMIGEMHAGHNRSGGGDIVKEKGPSGGLLGADFEVVNGTHRISKIYDGESWNPYLKGPLSAPGLNINVGDFILAVNGYPLGENDNIFSHLEDMADKQVTLRIARQKNGQGARNVVVETIKNENALRLWSWVEENRNAVDKATEGRVGYVYLPNTAGSGFTFFNRLFFSQVDKDAIIIDERSNGGGQAANYVTDVLSRSYLSGWKDRDGLIFNTPGGAMYGPKVMLIDQDAGSGGDFLPYSFREMGIGPLIGTRTWGGLIGISANPILIDGGYLTVPYFRFFDTNGNWSVENEGVPPDIKVALDPISTNEGRDNQLEKAISVTLNELKKNPSLVPQKAPPLPKELGK